MKALRLVGLALATAAAVAAAILLRQLSFASALPDWLLARVPATSPLLRWLPGDVLVSALLLAVIAVTLFAIIIPEFRVGPQRRLVSEPGALDTDERLYWLALVIVVAMIVVVLLGMSSFPIHGMATTAIWVAAGVMVLMFGVEMDRQRKLRVIGGVGGSPEQGWPWLLAALALATFLFTWRNASMPASIPTELYPLGVQAIRLPDMMRAGLLQTGSSGVPYLSTVWSGLWIRLLANPFLGWAWSGLFAGLWIVFAIWLLACELLRRPTQLSANGEPIEDDGRTAAGWSAIAAALMVPLIVYSRLPLLIDVAALGTLSIWALLRALRLGSYRAAALSGLGIGVSVLLFRSGLTFVWIALAIWLGAALLRRSWLIKALGGLGWRGMVLWLVALLVSLGPAIVLDISSADGVLAQWTRGLGDASAGFRTVVGALGLPLDGTSAPTMALVGSLLVPLLILAAGGLAAHVDHLVGWVCLWWVAIVLLVASPVSLDGADWSIVLLAAPPIAIALAFALDRTRATLVAVSGEWIASAATTLAIGLFLVAALITWRSWPKLNGTHPDEWSAIARPLAALEESGDLALVAEPESPQWQDPSLVFAGWRHPGDRIVIPQHDPARWPERLEPGTRVLVLPRFAESLPLLRERYPGSQLSTMRDSNGNPSLYIYVTG